jgi:hypothetical protein
MTKTELRKTAAAYVRSMRSGLGASLLEDAQVRSLTRIRDKALAA